MKIKHVILFQGLPFELKKLVTSFTLKRHDEKRLPSLSLGLTHPELCKVTCSSCRACCVYPSCCS